MTRKEKIKHLELLFTLGLKDCSSCKQTKTLNNFTKDKTTKFGYKTICKICKANDEKNRRKNPKYKERIKIYKSAQINRTRDKNSSLKRIFGIDLNEYNKMLKNQNNKCAICKKEDKADKRQYSLVVDHCHSTGKVRGLLCGNCNFGIGNFKDNCDNLNNAIQYLKESK